MLLDYACIRASFWIGVSLEAESGEDIEEVRRVKFGCWSIGACAMIWTSTYNGLQLQQGRNQPKKSWICCGLLCIFPRPHHVQITVAHKHALQLDPRTSLDGRQGTMAPETIQVTPVVQIARNLLDIVPNAQHSLR